MVNELLETYSPDIFNLDYLKQYWVFDGDSKKKFFLIIIIS